MPHSSSILSYQQRLLQRYLFVTTLYNPTFKFLIFFFIKKPSTISFDEAASIPLALATASQALYGDRKSPDVYKLTPAWETGGEQAAKGKTIFVIGGSSSVGQYGDA